jgi:hypothetical protein
MRTSSRIAALGAVLAVGLVGGAVAAPAATLSVKEMVITPSIVRTETTRSRVKGGSTTSSPPAATRRKVGLSLLASLKITFT